jgi:tetratricopeptide (TPR) repeat protein
MTIRVTSVVAAAAIVLATATAPFAAGGGGGGTTPTTTKCKKGKIWDKGKKKCVTAKSGLLNDDALYEAGRELAYADRYEEAINVLKLAKNQDDPRILNYLGFSHRKAGHMEIGMAYYREAIKADPDYVLARSYMGQALVQMGDLEGARVQLGEIRRRAGPNNYPYFALAQTLRNRSAY